MVYNALKLFMDMNSELFDECVHAFKQNVMACVDIFALNSDVLCNGFIVNGNANKPDMTRGRR